MRLLTVFIAFAAITTAASTANAAPKCSQSDLSGRWYVEYDIDSNSQEHPTCEISISAVGAITMIACYPQRDSVSGTLKLNNNCRLSGKKVSAPIFERNVKGWMSPDKSQFFGVLMVPDFEEPYVGRLHAHRIP